MPEISSQPLGQSLLQLYSNSLQPNPINIVSAPTYETAKPAKQPKRHQQTVQRQIHQAQQQQIKQIQQQQQQLAQQHVSQQAPIISLPSYHLSTETQPSSRAQQPPTHSSQITKPKGPTIPSSPITPSSTTPNPPETVPTTSLPTSTPMCLTTFSEYTNELNDVLQVSSEVLNITSSPKSGSKDNPGSPIDVTAFLNVETSSSKFNSTPPTINTSPISNPETRMSEPMDIDTISETQDLLDKLQSLSSSGDLSETSILQKLSPSQINLLTSHLETSQASATSTTAKIATPTTTVESSAASDLGRKNLLQTINDSHGLPIQQFEDFSEENKVNKSEGIITLGGVNKEPLTIDLEDMLNNSERNSDQDTGNMSGTESDRLGLRKPTISYPAMIAMAILNSESKRLLLGDIYRFIMDKYPYYRLEGQGWRNSIRHNLSLNDCFMKAGRAESGKGHYWTVRPDSIKEFQNGGYRRRLRRTCTRGGSLSMSSQQRTDVTIGGDRPHILLGPFVNTLKQEICSPAASPGNKIPQTESEQT